MLSKKQKIIISALCYLVLVAVVYCLGISSRQRKVLSEVAAIKNQNKSPEATPELEKAPSLRDWAGDDKSSFESGVTVRKVSFDRAGTAILRNGVLRSDQPASGLTALRKALDLRDPILRREEFCKMLQGLTKEDFSDIAMIRRLIRKTDGYERHLLMYAWGQKDGAHALDISYADDNGGDWVDQITVIKGWASVDLDGAIERLRKDRGKTPFDLTQFLVGSIANRNLPLALNLVQEMRADAPHGGWDFALQQAVRKGINNDPRFILDYYAKTTDKQMKEELERYVSCFMPAKDPVVAADWAVSINVEYPWNALCTVFSEWPEAADVSPDDWIAGLGSSELRSYAVKKRLYQIASKGGSILDVAEWIRNAPQIPEYDPAIELMSDNLKRFAPDIALDWATLLKDKEKRFQVTDGLVKYWNEKDPSGFTTYIEGITGVGKDK